MQIHAQPCAANFYAPKVTQRFGEEKEVVDLATQQQMNKSLTNAMLIQAHQRALTNGPKKGETLHGSGGQNP